MKSREKKADHQYDPTSAFRPFIRNILKNDVGRPAAIPSLVPLGMSTTAVNEKNRFRKMFKVTRKFKSE